MKKFFVLLISVIMALSVSSLVACDNETPQNSGSQEDTTQGSGEDDNTAGGEEESGVTQKQLGGLSPEAAHEYIKSKPDIVIVQVNTAYWKIEPGFTGAMWIPHDEMATRYNEIPQGRPVILHCGAGVVSVPAYETLIEKRPDIPELSYIAGSPHSIMAEYNAWLESQT